MSALVSLTDDVCELSDFGERILAMSMAASIGPFDTIPHHLAKAYYEQVGEIAGAMVARLHAMKASLLHD